jgi:hypothetical protein
MRAVSATDAASADCRPTVTGLPNGRHRASASWVDGISVARCTGPAGRVALEGQHACSSSTQSGESLIALLPSVLATIDELPHAGVLGDSLERLDGPPGSPVRAALGNDGQDP